MVQSKNSTSKVPADALELITECGVEGMSKVIQMLVNAAMVAEREKYLKAAPHERTEERVSQANGFKPKTMKTRLGELEFRVPQTRDGLFYPSSLEKGVRSERALKIAIAEMYIQGVSTRKVAAITQQLAGVDISSTTVSKVTAELDETLREWRERPLGTFSYLYLDARYEKVRHGGKVINCGVLVAVGVQDDGRRDVLGVSVALSEAEPHWRKFLENLKDRGLQNVKLAISDAHPGLKAALTKVFPLVPWQRCQVHLQREAQRRVPRVAMKIDVISDIRAVFNAYDKETAEDLIRKIANKWRKSAPALSEWILENLHEGLAAFDFPERHRIRIRSTNLVERLNRELKRRTRVVSIFPNEASLLRLVSALLSETSEEWQNTTTTYLPTGHYDPFK
jgi:putative transposase